MKNKKAFVWSLLIAAAFCFSAIGAYAQKPDVTGAWKLVEFSRGGDTAVLQKIPPVVEQIKLIAGNRFCWTNYTIGDKIVVNSAGGTFTQDGDRYVEQVESGSESMAPFFGKQAAYKFKIDGNRMRIDGTLDGSIRVIEIWERIE